MAYYYIEYTLFFDDDYEESESHVIEARNKKSAIKEIKNKVVKDKPNRISIDTIYQTSSDARP